MSCDKSSSLNTGRTLILADPCKDNTLAQIEAILDNFFNNINGIANGISNLDADIKRSVGMISKAIGGMVSSVLGNIEDKLIELIPKGIKALQTFLHSTGLQVPAIKAILSPIKSPLLPLLTEAIQCLGKKILDGAIKTFTDLLTGAVKNVVNAGACVAQQMLGAFTNQMMDIIDSVVGPLLDPIKNILGKFLSFDIKGIIATGIGALRKIQNLFTCAPKKECPASTKIRLGEGLEKDDGEEKQSGGFAAILQGAAAANSFLSGGESGGGPLSAATGNLLNDFEKTYGQWPIFGNKLSDSKGVGPCNFGNITSCGAPKVSFFGGGGIAAAGEVILGNIVENVDKENLLGDISKLGSIVGVNITNPGKGYKNPPLVSFSDSCRMGRGAFGRAVIEVNQNSPNYGQVIAVKMITVGDNYPGDIDEDVLFIDNVIIDDPGENYQENDAIDNFDIVVINGQIQSVVPKPGLGYNGLPDLNINSNTGFGAVLRPIMTLTKPQGELIQIIDCVR